MFNDLYEAQQKTSPLRVIGITNQGNKYQRISTLEPYITNGHLLFNTALDKQLMSQLSLYPTTHDDGPDCLSMAISQFINQSPFRTTSVRLGRRR
jgi:predicted phage terminase large subunit-like protein